MMNDKPETGNSFTPYSIIPMPKQPAWATPSFNPNAPYQVADAGISPQSAAGLEMLRRQMQGGQSTIAPTTPQTMQAIPPGWVQLPNGQFVSPEQYQKLQEMLRKRR